MCLKSWCLNLFRFVVPRLLHSDQGTNFEFKVIGEVCKLLDIEKTTTSSLHPQSDGQVERFNRTLIEMFQGKLKATKGTGIFNFNPVLWCTEV